MTQVWPIRALVSPGHSDWFRDGEMTQSEPMRSSESFAGAAGKEPPTMAWRIHPVEGRRSAVAQGEVPTACVSTEPTHRRGGELEREELGPGSTD